MGKKLDSDFLETMIEGMIKCYGLDDLISSFCDEIKVIESDDLYQCSLQYEKDKKQRKNIMQCKEQYEYIDATVIMPQQKDKKAYILLSSSCELVNSIRKTIHEFIHLYHRCFITKKMKLRNLYELEEYQDYKLFYYLDEFLTKKKEIILFYDFFCDNQRIEDKDKYISLMAKRLQNIKESSLDIKCFMREGLFAIAETMSYIEIFPDLFPNHFIESYTRISNIERIVKILESFTSIDVFIDNRDELREAITILENSYYANHQ